MIRTVTEYRKSQNLSQPCDRWFYNGLKLTSLLQGAEVLLPFTRTGYTAQVAGPAPKRPRVECVTSETGTVMLRGNGYVVPSSFSSIDGGCGKRFSP
jgi:hypothetical protein